MIRYFEFRKASKTDVEQFESLNSRLVGCASIIGLNNANNV